MHKKSAALHVHRNRQQETLPKGNVHGTQSAALYKRRSRYEPRSNQHSFQAQEKWYSSNGIEDEYVLIKEDPGTGYVHAASIEEIENRVEVLPVGIKSILETIILSRMTAKKALQPVYGMQWGSSVYLYPIADDLVERYDSPVDQDIALEVKKYGAKLKAHNPDEWSIEWTEKTLKDFYLNNILIHEIGHLHDKRNTAYARREAFANHFTEIYGFPNSDAYAKKRNRNKIKKRHHNT